MTAQTEPSGSTESLPPTAIATTSTTTTPTVRKPVPFTKLFAYFDLKVRILLVLLSSHHSIGLALVLRRHPCGSRIRSRLASLGVCRPLMAPFLICRLLHCHFDSGLSQTAHRLLFADSVNEFASSDVGTDITPVAVSFVYLGIGAGVTNFLTRFIFEHRPDVSPLVNHSLSLTTLQFMIAKIKTEYFRAIFRQEVAWHDMQSSAALSALFAANIPKMRSAYDERVR